MEMLQGAGFFAKLTLLIAFIPLVLAIMYVARPTERRLALMRPFSLAGIFAALSGGVLGLLNVLRSIGMTVGSSGGIVPPHGNWRGGIAGADVRRLLVPDGGVVAGRGRDEQSRAEP